MDKLVPLLQQSTVVVGLRYQGLSVRGAACPPCGARHRLAAWHRPQRTGVHAAERP